MSPSLFLGSGDEPCSATEGQTLRNGLLAELRKHGLGYGDLAQRIGLKRDVLANYLGRRKLPTHVALRINAELAKLKATPAGPKLLVVRCFYRCPHRVEGLDPDANHAAMERHYRAEHPKGSSVLRQGLARLAKTARRNGGLEP